MAIICKKKLIIEDSTNTQTNSYIVIHNSDGKTLTEIYNEFIKNKTNGKKECTHYILDDKTIYQTLKDNFAGTHTSGDGSYTGWGEGIKKGQVTNKNSIAIMVSDSTSVDLSISTENLIELIRHLMKNYNIPIENILRHGDTANVKCPLTIVNNKKWEYIIEQIKDRNDKQVAIKIDFKDFDIATDMKSEETATTTQGYTGSGQVIQLVFNDITVQESLSNANTSDNWIDMHKIKGITLHFYPPYHNCDVKGMPDYFKYYNWDRSFHYKVDCHTEIDFDKKPVSGKTRGGNDIGTSRPDVELIPGEGLYSGIIINGSGGNGGTGDSSTENNGTVIPSGKIFGWPLPKLTYISSPFGWRTIDGQRNNHKGIDIPAEKGTEIHSYAAGKVVNSETHSSYGNFVKIDHGNGCYTLYAHQSERKVNLGDTVTSGQVIGLVGNTGHSFGNHLHFELRINNERVDPALYVKPGGGSIKIPEGFEDDTASASLFRTMDREEPKIIYDNIDKGTICFASEENNQHTYIERALFNNQHQKYTLSIGEFFDNQDNAIEKDQDYDYPKTEKKLIEQCAKALYDEGFTSDQLWREFDLNRTPSPFLYLDRNKWILFCKEVDKQVEWLNKKYGKVTATYVPNNLLTDENTNEFIEMSPDLGINTSGGTAIVGGTSTTVDSLQGGTFIGDSRTVMLKSGGYLNNIDVHASSGKIASYFYKKDGSVNRLKDIQQNTKYILVWLGINNPDAVTATTDMLSYLKQNFICPIYVAKEFYVTKECTDPYIPNASTFNKKIDSYNTSIQNYCNKNGINFIDYTNTFTDGNYGKKEYYLSDGIHLNDKGQKQCIQEIVTNLTGKSLEDEVTTASLNIFSYSNTLVNIENNKEIFTIKDVSDTQADPDNKGRYCYVICDTAAYMYSGPDTANKKIRTCVYGDELKIEGAQGIFYKVTVDNKTGYIRAKNVSVIMIDKFGKTDKKDIGKECWTRFDNTEVSSKLTGLFHKTLDEQIKGKIIDLKEGYYYVEFEKDNIEGWVKAYRITTDYSSFKYELDDSIEEPCQKIDIEVIDGDFEGNTGEANNNNTSGWSKLGKFDFIIIDNPEWDQEGHWNYRDKKFARIHNVSKETTGILNNIIIENTNNGNFQIRISAWIKQVTQEDYPDAIEVDAVESLTQYGITYALLDKNNKIKHSEKIEIPKDHTKFGQRSCVFSNVKSGEYKLFIGSNNKYDIFIDDITVEQIYNYNESIGDSTPSGNIVISGVGNTSVDNGGIMAYNVEKPSNPLALQPEIKTIITQEEYEEIMSNANSKLIDIYTRQFEPYDKGLEQILEAPIVQDDRLNILTERIESFTGNDIFYNVIETGPGSIDHCVKPADELNILYKQVSVKCDPIYPDLIIPPNYSTSEYDSKSENSIPLQALEEGTLEDKDLLNKQISYDYSILEDKEKKSKGAPINYNDPYPIDDKITELEQHYPKVSIDEIESRLYSCNHPGCPIAHPMAKNFAMINDMQLAQSKKIEQRLARIENILSWAIRNLGRTASRMNINCVYYGGQDIFSGKYKSIRCMHDDRIHDGLSVTLDQCLCCTRYEPIIGQIYDILDETGINGATILDDMQMSYMTLDEFKNLNKVERRSTSYQYAKVNEDDKDKIPKSLIDEWKEKDKDKYKEKLKEKYSSKKEREKELEKAKESDYIFTMNWDESEIDGQEPDVKKYPTEGITSKYYKTNGDKGENIVTNIDLDEELNKDVIEDINKYDSIVNGEWVDTREKADTTQSNKYTSEDFYFENFNKNRTGYVFDSGFAGNIGLTTSGSVAGGLTGNECRNKIVEKAREIVQLHKDGKATYSNTYRTIDDTKRVTIQAGDKTSYKGSQGMIGYDCSSFASCCYKNAGLNSLYGKGCAAGTIMDEIVNNGGEMWMADEEGIKKAMPGDCIVCCGTSYESRVKPSKSDVEGRRKLIIYHIMVYLGNGEIAHASSPKPVPNSIRIDTYDKSHYAYGYSVFIRPKDLIEMDKVSGGSGEGISFTSGTIDGHNYVCVLNSCVCTNYCVQGDSTNGGGPFNIWGKGGASGLGAVAGCTLASHNIPYGTEIYFPDLKHLCKSSSGTWIVTDTGGSGFDFDVLTQTPDSTGAIHGWDGPPIKAYVVKWGSGHGIAASFTKMYRDKWKKAWQSYKKLGGCLVNLLKFNKEDADIKNKPWY